MAIVPPLPAVVGTECFSTFRPFSILISPDETRVIYPTPSAVVARCFPDSVSFDAKLVETLTGNKTPLIACGISPNGDVAVGGDANGTVYVWRNLHKLIGGTVTSASRSIPPSTRNSPTVYSLGLTHVNIVGFAFSDDSRHMVVHGIDRYAKKVATVIIPDAGNAVGQISGHTLGVTSADFRPGKAGLIVTGGAEGNICFHSGPPYTLKKSVILLEDSKLGVNCVRFSPCGTKVAAACADGTVRIISAPDWDVLSEFTIAGSAKKSVLSVIWSPQGERLLVSTAEGSLTIINASTGAEIDATKILVENALPVGLAWGPKREWAVVVLHDSSIHGFRTTDGLSAFDTSDTFTWRGVKGGCTCAGLNSLTGQLCLGDTTGSLLMLSAEDGDPKPLKALQGPSDATIRSAVVGTRVAAVMSNDGNLRVIKIPKDAQPKPGLAKSKLERAAAASVSPNSTIDSPRKTTRAIDLDAEQEEEWKVIGCAEIKDTPIVGLNIAENDGLLVLCASGTIRCYPFEACLQRKFSELWSIKMDGGGITSGSVSVDGSLVGIVVEPSASYPLEKLGDEATDDKLEVSVLELYEIDDFEKEEGFRLACCYKLTTKEISAIAMSPAGSHIAWADAKRTVVVMEVETGKVVAQWKLHATKITSLEWSPDGRKLVSGSHEKNIIIYDLTYNFRYLSIEEVHQGGTTCARFLLNNLVLTTGADGTLAINEFSLGPPPKGAVPYIHEGDDDEGEEYEEESYEEE